jgi:hypothetical protein
MARTALRVLTAASAVVGLALTPGIASAATAAEPAGPSALAHSSTGSAGDPNTTVTFTVTNGALGMTAPTSVNLGGAAPGGTVSGILGPVTVTDNRALLSASWTASASSTNFTTGNGTPAETIPAGNATYDPGTVTSTGVITTSEAPITLSTASQTIVTATAGVGDNTATWDPTMTVAIPPAAVAGLYTSTLSESAF